MSSLHTDDANRARAFYGAVFGWEPEPFSSAGAQLTLWRLPGYVGEPDQLVPRDAVAVMTPNASTASAAAVPPNWNVNLRVDDTDTTADLATRLGGTVILPPQDTPVGLRVAVLADPQGAVFSISS